MILPLKSSGISHRCKDLEEQRNAIGEFYEIVRQEVERYEQAKVLQERRLRPLVGVPHVDGEASS